MNTTSDAPDKCPECEVPWQSIEAVHTGDTRGHEGWEDWCYCGRCKNDLFYPHRLVEERCAYCDDTGDVHGRDGEWRGACVCTAGRRLALPR